MAWKRTLGGIIAACALLTACTTGNRSTVTDRVILSPGQDVRGYRLVAVDPQGRAEFRNIVTGDIDHFPHILAAPGQGFQVERQSRHHTLFDYKVESTDPAKQQATVVVTATTR